MSIEEDSSGDSRGTKRAKKLAEALDFALADALDMDDVILLGFAIKYDGWQCLLTLKAVVGGQRSVAFLGSNNAANVIIKAVAAAEDRRLRWKTDRYTPDGV